MSNSINPRITFHDIATVYYYSDYGTPPPTNNYLVSNSPYTAEILPTLTANNYIHIGWYSTSTFDEGTEVKVGDNIPDGTTYLYAKWVDKVLIKVSDMQNIANGIRTISNTTETLNPSEMGNLLSTLSPNIETCTVQLVDYPLEFAYTTIDESGTICYKHEFCSNSSVTITCLKNSIIVIKYSYIKNSSQVHSLFYSDTMAAHKIVKDRTITNSIGLS